MTFLLFYQYNSHYSTIHSEVFVEIASFTASDLFIYTQLILVRFTKSHNSNGVNFAIRRRIQVRWGEHNWHQHNFYGAGQHWFSQNQKPEQFSNSLNAMVLFLRLFKGRAKSGKIFRDHQKQTSKRITHPLSIESCALPSYSEPGNKVAINLVTVASNFLASHASSQGQEAHNQELNTGGRSRSTQWIRKRDQCETLGVKQFAVIWFVM